MLSKFPLISVLVLCYNNQNYIYENLKSIFEQTYPNIEVLIADDASQEFRAASLVDWINKNRTSNISKISIYENIFNIGTVSNLEMLQKKSTGEYLFNIAADDTLFDKDVLMRLYNRAQEIDSDVKIIFAETEMWDEKLQNKIGDFLGEEAINKIKNSTTEDLFAEGSWHPFFPACYLYSRNLLDCLGNLSEKYKLIEDWPTILIALRNGIKPYYCDIRSTIKHRSTEVGHGNLINKHKILLESYRDLYDVYVYEVEPYLNMLSLKERHRAHKCAMDRFRSYYKTKLAKSINIVNQDDNHRKKECLNSVTVTVQKFNEEKKSQINNCLTISLNRERLKNIAYRISTKKAVLITSFISFIIFMAATLFFIHNYVLITIILAMLFSANCCVIVGEILVHYYFRK